MPSHNAETSDQGEKMNILFLSIGRLNDLEFRGIYTDLLRQFRDKGHKVYVVSPREKRLNKPTEYVNENGVQFLRVRIGNITKTNVIEKGISTIMIESLFLKAIKKHIKDIKFDLVIYSTPPITFGKVIGYVKKRDNAKSYLLLKDIFPQNAVDLNMFSKNSLIYKYFRLKEKQLYAQSDFIGCMSQANVDFVLKNNAEVPTDTVEVCPNSIEPLTIEKDETKVRKIRQKYNIPFDKTVFVYGGNLGKPQGIDFLIKCLKANKDNNQVYFVIAGSGTEFNKLKSFFNSEKLTNAQLFAQLPKDDYELLANSCDVGLIFLDKRFTIPNFPSRLLSYMQASMPVLAATDVNTDIGKVIEQGKFGFWCESNNTEQFNKTLQQLCDKELRKQMGVNARRYLEENYTSKHSYEIIMRHFK
ncbi:glycosyltransferase family 4 protein [Chryseomicrobium palamuruense]|uniref:Glycosyltransferase family 4 protein n=1 Tax=Chryseomicrobium palamuruense TaxID=682973 RepID=A0ABV8UTR4_9BACL